MNINEIAKELTREEFEKCFKIEGRLLKLVYRGMDYVCPEDIGLENIGKEKYCDNYDKYNPEVCKKCFLEVIRNIKFKGEDEVELNRGNAIEFAKTVTKEKFIEEMNNSSSCPKYFGLKRDFCDQDNCNKCIELSTEDAIANDGLTFKDTPVAPVEITEKTAEPSKTEFLCVKDFYMKPDFGGDRVFTAGNKYIGVFNFHKDGYWFKDDSENKHEMGTRIVYEYFIEIDKVFNTATAFSTLAANSEIKVKRVSDGLILQIKDGFYTWDNGHKFLSPDDQWILVEDKPVSFEEAVKAFKDSKTVICKYFGDIFTYDPIKSKWGMEDQEGRAIGCPEILGGKWFIK